MALPTLPVQGQNPWFTPRNNWDEAVKSELEGRLSAAQLSGTFARRVSVDVRDFGAVGDGVADDTAAFQAAANFVAPTGGDITVPNGSFIIDPTAATDVGIWVNAGGVEIFSNTRLLMSPGTILKAKTNTKSVYKVLRVFNADNVVIQGGSILGDRDTHTGATGEWGYGISVMGSRNVTIRDIAITKCWGDGVNLQRRTVDGFTAAFANQGVLLQRVRSLNNRRQGISLESGVDVHILDCEGSYNSGTAPSAGLDIEPPTEQGIMQGIRVTNFVAKGNGGRGITISTWEQTDTILIDGAWLEGNGTVLLQSQIKSSCYGTNVTLRNITTRNTLSGQAAMEEQGIRSGFTVEGCDLDAPLVILGGFGGTWSLNYTVRDSRIVGGVKASRARFLRLENLDIELTGTQVGFDFTYAGGIETQYPSVVRCRVMNGQNAVVSGNGTMGSETLEVIDCKFFDQSEAAVILKGAGPVVRGNLFRGYANTAGTAAITRVSGVDISAARIQFNRFNRAKYAGAAATNTPGYATDLGTTTLFGGRIQDNIITAGALAPAGALGSGQITAPVSFSSGPTANRPAPTVEDMVYMDYGLNKIIWVRGGIWRDAMGTAV